MAKKSIEVVEGGWRFVASLGASHYTVWAIHQVVNQEVPYDTPAWPEWVNASKVDEAAFRVIVNGWLTADSTESMRNEYDERVTRARRSLKPGDRLPDDLLTALRSETSD